MKIKFVAWSNCPYKLAFAIARNYSNYYVASVTKIELMFWTSSAILPSAKHVAIRSMFKALFNRKGSTLVFLLFG